MGLNISMELTLESRKISQAKLGICRDLNALVGRGDISLKTLLLLIYDYFNHVSQCVCVEPQ